MLRRQVISRIFAFLMICLCLETVDAQSPLALQARKNPNNPDILNSYGIELANSGDLTGAIRVWRRALDFAPKNVHLYNNIGSALKRLGHDQYAFAWYTAAIKIKPVYWTYYNLSLLYRDRGQINEAVWALEKSLQLNSEFAQARDLLRRLKSGMINVENIKEQEPVKTKVPVSFSETEIARTLPEKNTVAKIKKPVGKENPAKFVSNNYSQPGSESPEKILKLPDDNGGQVFLTFDGGADDDGVDSILASLQRHSIKSTFFLTGRFALKYPEKARKIIALGHEIANHSMNHPDMKNFNAEKIAREIAAAEAAFEKVIGHRGAPFFRFPFGHQNKRVEKIVESLGYRPVYWHIDTIDWREDPVETIVARVEKKLRRGSVILMHLGSKNGAKALDRIIEIILARGYSPARLSDLDPSLLASLP
ncbi:MAG: hypothetical protein Kow0029_01750 [Candidatus Rifleibacteriota bacterium]